MIVFHNPNSAEDTANYLFKILIEVNAGKVERAIDEATLGRAEESEVEMPCFFYKMVLKSYEKIITG